LEAGATVELIVGVIKTQCAKLAAKGREPPMSLAYLCQDVEWAMVETQRRRAPEPPVIVTDPAGEDRMWHTFEALLETQGWVPQFGPEPGAYGCTAPSWFVEKHRALQDRLRRAAH
jgi:hypothetical protein